MDPKPRILVDANVVLDVLQRREPHYILSAQVLARVELGLVEGALAAHTWTTLYYLISRGVSAEHARAMLSDLLQFFVVAPVNQAVIQHALSLPYQDLEDAVQMAAAVHYGADYVVTRDVQDYAAGPLPALSPAEFLALL
jgi:predicted nucleic acid-binding protein